MAAWLKKERGIELLGPLGFENAYALAMRRDRAEALGVRTVADLAALTPQLSIGGDYEFFDRPEWAALREAYGLKFRQQRQMDSTFMYGAVVNGEVDVISAFSSDGRIARYDLVVLEDPKQALPPYDAVLLLAPARAGDRALRGALLPLVGKIDVTLMQQANLRADRDKDKETPAQAARWLWGQIGGR
jgi:osmoprotectant transport system permease protein